VIIGLILAGGLSSRMGEDKATLMIDGQTMLERTAMALRAAGADLVVVSGARPGGIPDRWPQAGPVGGIASAAEVLPDAEWLIVPVDMPRLGQSVLAPLLSERSLCATRWAHDGQPRARTPRRDDAADRTGLLRIRLAGPDRHDHTATGRAGSGPPGQLQHS
jgi:molybdopterin-guanine dinucleotide biosynthesis protein A